jgi:aspartyl protease family protein
MSISTGTRSALGEALSWAFAGLIIVGSLVYFDDLKSVFATATGLKPGAIANTAPVTPTTTAAAPLTSAGYLVKLDAGPYGHYNTEARVNGRAVKVLVDTGASFVALTHEDAERVGVYVRDSDYTHRTQTANGTTRVAVVELDRISIGDIEVRNVRATVHEPGTLHVTLLGMSFLSKLRRTEMRNGQLILEN